MRILRVLLAVALVAAVPAALRAADRQALAPYELNAIIPLTGGGAFLGSDYVEVFKAMELLINSSGGIAGHPLKFVTADTQSNGQVDVQLVNGLIAKHVPVFIDGAPATVCQASLPLVEKSGPVDYCLSPAIHPPIGGYAFTVNASTFDLASVSLRNFRERGWKRVATLTSTDASGQDYDRAIPAVLALPENRDLHLVAQEHFNPSDISVAAQVARIKAADPQVLLALTTGTSLGTVFRALRDAGVNVPVSTNSPNMTYAQMSAYAASLPTALYFPTLRAMTPNETLPGPLHDAQAVYLKAFRAIGVKPDGGHANAWDATMIVINAVRHLGPNATAQEIRDYILHLHGYVGANGIYDFTNSTSGLGQNSAIVAQWIPAKTTWIQVSKPRGFLK